MVGAHPDWRAIHDELAQREPSSLTAAELDRLGESLFWLDRPDDSIAVLGRAFTAHAADGNHAGAAMAAWQLFFDHALVGEMALANGWLERARRHCAHVEGSAAAGFLAVAEAALVLEIPVFRQRAHRGPPPQQHLHQARGQLPLGGHRVRLRALTHLTTSAHGQV